MVNGTNADDIIRGTMDGDLLSGLAGADEIYGGGSGDILDGGDDDDRLFGENGDDTLYGGLGMDTLEGGDGKDQLRGGDGDDVHSDDSGSGDSLFGEEGNDSLIVRRYSTYGAVTADGGAGNDRIWLAVRTASAIEVRGGAGNDVVEVDSLVGGAAIALGEGQDTIRLLGSAAAYQLGLLRVSDFQAGPGGDRIDLFDYFNARLAGWNGTANPFGAAGFARLVQVGTATELQVDADGGANGFVAVVSFANTDVASFNAYNLGGFPADGSTPGLVLNGTGSAETINGGIGADLLNGLGGADQLYGGGGADTADGGAENDLIFGQDGADTLSGGLGRRRDRRRRWKRHALRRRRQRHPD